MSKSIVETNDVESSKETNEDASVDAVDKSAGIKTDRAADHEKAAFTKEKPEQNKSNPPLTPSETENASDAEPRK
ncbi:MAG: hypothetical protein U0930_09050 [Pirellulales bacterium]